MLFHSEELQLICLNPQDFSSETCGLGKYLGQSLQKLFLFKHIKYIHYVLQEGFVSIKGKICKRKNMF